MGSVSSVVISAEKKILRIEKSEVGLEIVTNPKIWRLHWIQECKVHSFARMKIILQDTVSREVAREIEIDAAG